MYEIAVVGAKNSGKTTLVEKLIPLLVDCGMKVCTIKHTAHRHSFDTEGKDTFRHRAAGSDLTMAISEGEFALFSGDGAIGQEIKQRIMSGRFDICVIEGDKSSDVPKIFVTRNLDLHDRAKYRSVIVTYGNESAYRNAQNFREDETEQLAAHIVERALAHAAGVNHV